MPKQNVPLLAFNRGIVSSRALARIDIERIGMSAEVMTNWMPQTIGPMALRPGLGLIGSVPSESYLIPFHRSTNDVALLEFSNGSLRIWRDDALVSRPAPSGTINNGDFSSGLSGWSIASESTAIANAVGGRASLRGTAFAEAKIRQQVSGSGAVRIVVARGPVKVRIGTSLGLSDLFDTTLDTGTHSIVVDQAFHIELANDLRREVLLDSVTMESSGPLVLPGFPSVEWLRFTQSADVVFMASDGHQTMKIERRDGESWSFTEYQPDNGPFKLINNTSTTLTPSALSGEITLTASRPVFEPKHVGRLFRLDSSSQTVEAEVSGENQWSDDIRVTGIGASRAFTFVSEGTGNFLGTVQISIGGPGNWEDLFEVSNGSGAFANDDTDGQVVHFRIGCQSGDYTSGTRTFRLIFNGGSSSGTARINSVSSSTVAQASVLQNMGNDGSTADWYEDAWVDDYPTTVTLQEGRLWWFGSNKIWGSVSDDYTNMDTETEGDSGPIDRTIGKGPVNRIHWAAGVTRLLLGTSGNEVTVKSSSFDEPITPTNFNQKPSSLQGSHTTDAVLVDSDVMFVQRSENRLYLLTIDGNEYKPFDMTALQPEIATGGIKRLMVQRQPDIKIHAVLNDGTAAILLFNPAEDVRCWMKFETDGLVEDVCVLPGAEEDQVYYVINRNGTRLLEKWTHEGEHKLADSHVIGNGPVISGLGHLEGREVVAWSLDENRDLGVHTVANGSVTVEAAGECVVGLYYEADYKSTKLAYAAGSGTALTQRKEVSQLGLVLHDTHARGLFYGPAFDDLQGMPRTEDWGEVDENHIWPAYDFDATAFDERWGTDSRLCLRAQAPRPATVMAAILLVETRDKS